MKLSEAVKCYEYCFGPENPSYACAYDNCPLHDALKIVAGDLSGEGGKMTWQIEGCSLLSMLEKVLKNKKPGKLIPE